MSKPGEQTKGGQGKIAVGSVKTLGKPPREKRLHTDVSPINTSAEDMSIINHTLDDISEEMKGIRGTLDTLMKKEDIEAFVKHAVKDILEDFNKNMEFTITTKVEAKTKVLSEKMDKLSKENEQLRKDFLLQKQLVYEIKKNSEISESRSKHAEERANYNEQYSRKNNIKFMNVPEVTPETEETLTIKICSMIAEKGATITPSKIIAIHRIPGKPGYPKPVLVKLQNNNEKTKVMRLRASFKASGSRLVDDVTKANSQLISRLLSHDDIENAWYYNGSVYGKSKTTSNRHKFELYDDIGSVLNQ